MISLDRPLEGAQTLLVLSFPMLDSLLSCQGQGTDPCDLTPRDPVCICRWMCRGLPSKELPCLIS